MCFRTRYWYSDQGSSTAVQFRTDADPMVYLHCNLGWVPIGNAPRDEAGAELFAEEIAAGYRLVESDAELALEMAGV